MPIRTNLSKEELAKAMQTISIRPDGDGYLLIINLIGVKKVKTFDDVVNFLRGFYEDSKVKSTT